MIARAAGVLLCVLSIAAAIGCLPRQPEPARVHHYTLHYEPPESEGRRLDAVLQVQPFSEAPPFDSRMMVYQERHLQPEQDYYHRWRSDPGDMVAYLLRRDLRESGLFRAVLSLESAASSTHTMEGTVERFLEVDTGSGRAAVLSLSATLLRNDVPTISQRVVLQRTYAVREPVRGSRAEDVALAMSRALRTISARILRDLHNAVRSGGREAPPLAGCPQTN
jgi:cholesterol transport system auxiliary component